MLAVLLKLFAALLLVAINGFFVLSEFAIVKVRRTRLEELTNNGNKTAAQALNIVKNLDSYLSSIQLGITLASLGLGWLGEPAIADLLRPLFERFFGGNTVLLHSISFIIAFTLITFLHVVLGELVPKSIAIQKTEPSVLFTTWPMVIFHKLSYPIVYIFDHIAAFFLKLIGLSPGEEHEQAHSEEELRMIVNASHTGGILDDTEGQLLDNMFTFSDKTAREVMIPRTDMICLYLDDSYDENLKVVTESSHTRFPLCRTDKDNVIGMIHLRDLLENETSGNPVKDLENLKREILFVPETLNVSNIMNIMQKKHIHLSVVVDEYGGTAGLISLEDILEEIVGDINDEYDLPEDPDTTEIAPSVYEISGSLEQKNVEKLLNVDLGDQDDETIGGVVFSLIGRKPEIGDKVEAAGYMFEVIAIDHLRIERLKVYPSPAEPETSDLSDNA